MKNGKVFFHPIDGSGPLTISWSSEPKGDAMEAEKGAGVGFFSGDGELLCVIFDDVKPDQDHQILEFNHKRVEITVKNGRVAHAVSVIRKTKPKAKRRIKRKQTA